MKQKIKQTHLPRRRFLQASAALVALYALPRLAQGSSSAAPKLSTEVLNMEQWQLTEAEWQKRLSPEQFRVLRKHGTEPSRSSPLDDEKRAGIFHCAGCDLSLFKSETKFDSGTGWPSFYDFIEGHIGTSKDFKLVWPRTEVHCARCKGHLGHVFNDGPAPTGKRYCMNGVAMIFKAA